MSELEKMLAQPGPPRLSADFSRKVMASLPRERAETAPQSASFWLRVYWLCFAAFVIWQVNSWPMPWWARFVLIPVLYAAALAPGRTWLRLFAPALR
ncbi:MAG: hypothetical protein ABI823_20100 [Bryobacteraceae bacterium]